MRNEKTKREIFILLAFALKTCFQFAWFLSPFTSKKDDRDDFIILTICCIANIFTFIVSIITYFIVKKLEEVRRLNSDGLGPQQNENETREHDDYEQNRNREKDHLIEKLERLHTQWNLRNKDTMRMKGVIREREKLRAQSLTYHGSDKLHDKGIEKRIEREIIRKEEVMKDIEAEIRVVSNDLGHEDSMRLSFSLCDLLKKLDDYERKRTDSIRLIDKAKKVVDGFIQFISILCTVLFVLLEIYMSIFLGNKLFTFASIITSLFLNGKFVIIIAGEIESVTLIDSSFDPSSLKEALQALLLKVSLQSIWILLFIDLKKRDSRFIIILVSYYCIQAVVAAMVYKKIIISTNESKKP